MQRVNMAFLYSILLYKIVASWKGQGELFHKIMLMGRTPCVILILLESIKAQ